MSLMGICCSRTCVWNYHHVISLRKEPEFRFDQKVFGADQNIICGRRVCFCCDSQMQMMSEQRLQVFVFKLCDRCRKILVIKGQQI